MHFIAALLGLGMIVIALREGFDTIVMPRTSLQGMRMTRLFYKQGWRAWAKSSHTLSEDRREGFLSAFGPLSLIGLLALWALCLIVGFGLVQWAQTNEFTPKGSLTSLLNAFYFSGTTLFTLGYGDITPTQPLTRGIAVFEAGTGFGFLAIVIGYLPTLYQSFSRRETIISMLDSRASSPPSAGELVSRAAINGDCDNIEPFLKEWEVWCAELLESHLSYPVLAFYRSQHAGQSWVSALATIMDTCALVKSGIIRGPQPQARHTFAIGRHAIVDISTVFGIDPTPTKEPRMSERDWTLLCEKLVSAGLNITTSDEARGKLNELRQDYEPLLNALAIRFLMPVPSWIYEVQMVDNWRSDPWKHGEVSHL